MSQGSRQGRRTKTSRTTQVIWKHVTRGMTKLDTYVHRVTTRPEFSSVSHDSETDMVPRQGTRAIVGRAAASNNALPDCHKKKQSEEDHEGDEWPNIVGPYKRSAECPDVNQLNCVRVCDVPRTQGRLHRSMRHQRREAAYVCPSIAPSGNP